MKKRKSYYKPVHKKTGPKGPNKWSDEVVRQLKQAFGIGCTVTEACLYAKISRPTFYANCKEGSELFNEFMDLRETPILMARDTIFRAIKANADDAKWYLKNKRRDEFAEKSITDVQSQGERIEGFNFVVKKDNETNDRPNN